MYYYTNQISKYKGFDNAIKILRASGIEREIVQKFMYCDDRTTINSICDAYVVVSPLPSAQGLTWYYEPEEFSQGAVKLEMTNIKAKNPNIAKEKRDLETLRRLSKELHELSSSIQQP